MAPVFVGNLEVERGDTVAAVVAYPSRSIAG
jgi:hypothetical protein